MNKLRAFKDDENNRLYKKGEIIEIIESDEYNGVEYPVVKMEISRTSHPFYTGKSKLIDTAGRIDKFKTKYAKHVK